MFGTTRDARRSTRIAAVVAQFFLQFLVLERQICAVSARQLGVLNGRSAACCARRVCEANSNSLRVPYNFVIISWAFGDVPQ